MKNLSDQERLELKRSKDMSPAARLDWLAAAREFALAPKRQVRKRK